MSGLLRTRTTLLVFAAALAFALTWGSARAEAQAAGAEASTEPSISDDRSEAYYHFSVGHLYHHLAMQFARQEYLTRAIEEYQAAMEVDPSSVYIPQELVQLYASSNRLEEAIELGEKVAADHPESAEIRSLMGNIYRSFAYDRRGGFDREMAQKGIDQFEKARAIDSSDVETLLALAKLYQDSGEGDKARRTYLAVLELKQNDAQALAGLASVYIQADETDKAIEALEKVIRTAGSDGRYLAPLAQAYTQAGRPKDAAEAYRKLLEQTEEAGGNSIAVRAQLAENLTHAGELSEALSHFEMLAEEQPRNYVYHLRLSQIYRQRRRFDEAWTALKEAQRLDPENLDVKYNTVLLLDAEMRRDEAIAGMEQILEDTRKDDDEYSSGERANRQVFLENLAALQRGKEDFDGARETYGRIAELDPDAGPRVASMLIETYRAERDFERALAVAEEAIEQHPDHRPLLIQRATVLAETGDAPAGAELVESLLSGEPADIDLYLTLAQVWEKGKAVDEAVAALEKADELAVTDRAKLAVLFSRGSVLERFKRHQESEAAFRELLEIDPDNSSALNYLGYMLADRGVKLSEAHDMIQRALDLEPENGAYLDSLGWVYYRQEKLELAERYLLRSLKFYGRDPVVLTHLGDVYYKQGRRAEAKEHWQQSLQEWAKSAKADRDPTEIDKLRAKLEQLDGKTVSRNGDGSPDTDRP